MQNPRSSVEIAPTSRTSQRRIPSILQTGPQHMWYVHAISWPFNFAKIERLFSSFLRVLFSKGSTLKIPRRGTDTYMYKCICRLTSICVTLADSSMKVSCCLQSMDESDQMFGSRKQTSDDIQIDVLNSRAELRCLGLLHRRETIMVLVQPSHPLEQFVSIDKLTFVHNRWREQTHKSEVWTTLLA
jgi:hypothetical protein